MLLVWEIARCRFAAKMALVAAIGSPGSAEFFDRHIAMNCAKTSETQAKRIGSRDQSQECSLIGGGPRDAASQPNCAHAADAIATAIYNSCDAIVNRGLRAKQYFA